MRRIILQTEEPFALMHRRANPLYKILPVSEKEREFSPRPELFSKTNQESYDEETG
jgi:hypothetical protein